MDRQALVAALKAVRGVADADVDPDDAGGLGTLRLDLEAGVDEHAVADQVSKVLREKFGLGVDSDRVELVEVGGEEPASSTPTSAPAAAPTSAPATAPAAAKKPAPRAAVPPYEPAPAKAATDEPLPPGKPAAEPAVEPAPVAEPAASADEESESTPIGDATLADIGPARTEQLAEEITLPGSLTLPIPRLSSRPSIAKMHLVSAGFDVTVSVTLAADGRTAVGEARGMASPSGVHRAVATATLRAVEELLDGVIRVELEHLEVTTMGAERTVVVLLTLLTRRGSEPLTGAAAVRDDVRQAVIRATLDALNRRLEMLLTEA
ncbi:MAG TPA: hypothetical protein VMZ11_07525 [Mycobacteriales bacterium]|nr:hypothetical protein [Mycobacteriales bacterium]